MEAQIRQAVIEAADAEGGHIMRLSDAVSLLTDIVNHEHAITFVALVPTTEGQLLRVVPDEMMEV